MAAERSDLASTYHAAAATGLLNERHAVSDVLARRGVEVVDDAPDELAPALADRYLSLKAAGRL
jgi:uncharacterized protein (DUF58 family)